jgi:hypothetical protein
MELTFSHRMRDLDEWCSFLMGTGSSVGSGGGDGEVSLKLPAPLGHLANAPHGRYVLACRVVFAHRGGAQPFFARA